MSDSYTIKRIFIATPSDLNEERKIFFKMCNEVNANKAHSLGIHIEPLGWEDTLPGMGRPQELINRDITRADLFIVMFWERWGTATGKYSSGTEEEFAFARQLYDETRKPEIMLFFKEPCDIHLAENDDIKRIAAFRKQIEDEQILLFKEVKDSKDWENRFRGIVYTWLDDVYKHTVQHIDEKEPEVPGLLVEISYTSWMLGNSKDIVYFTINDQKSLGSWLELSAEEKQRYLYNQTSQYMYLILGSEPYVGILRYKHNQNSILLGQISLIHGSPIEKSHFLIPKQLDNILRQHEKEKTLLDWHAELPIALGDSTIKSKEIQLTGLAIRDDYVYIDVDRLRDLLEIDSRNVVWDKDSQTLVLVQRDKVIQYNNTSNIMLINGVSINNAVAPFFIDEEDVKWILLKASIMAFGLKVDYDSAKHVIRISGLI